MTASHRRGALAIVLSALFYIGMVGATWYRAPTTELLIAGVIPINDAWSYTQDTQSVIGGGGLSPVGSRRPLATSAMALRSWVVGNDYRLSLILQAGLAGLAGGIAALAVARTHGRIAGLIAFLGAAGFMSIFVTTHLTEGLGFTLGALAFALYWQGISARDRLTCMIGTAAFTAALLVRPGPITALPAIAALISLVLAQDLRGRLMVLASQIGAIALVYAATTVIGSALGSPQGVGQANFAQTLYGLAVAKSWHAAAIDHPEFLTMSERDGAALLYRLALDAVITSPFTLLQGLWRGAALFLEKGFVLGPVRVPGLALLIFIVAAALTVRRQGDRGPMLYSAVAGMGLLASIPLVFNDGRDRVYATMVPLVAALVGIGVMAIVRGLAQPSARIDGMIKAMAGAGGALPRPTGTIAVTVALMSVILIGPLLAFSRTTLSDRAASPCPGGLEAILAQIDGRTPLVRISDAGFTDLSLERLRAGMDRRRLPFHDLIYDLGRGSVIASAVRLNAQHSLVLVILKAASLDPLLARDRHAVVQICAEPQSFDGSIVYLARSITPVQ